MTHVITALSNHRAGHVVVLNGIPHTLVIHFFIGKTLLWPVISFLTQHPLQFDW